MKSVVEEYDLKVRKDDIGLDVGIELMRNNGMSDARLVLVERNEHSSVRVTMRSSKELEEYLESGMRMSLMEGTSTRKNAAGYID